MSKESRRRGASSSRNVGLWLALGGALVVGGLLVGWLLNTGGNRQAISRLSTGDFHSLAFSPTDPNMVFFGHHGGLLVSKDGGRTWQAASLQNADAMALAISPADPAIVYAAGHDVFVKSTDGGQTWSPVTHNLPGTDIHGFTVDPENANKVYAHVVGQTGLFVSDDGGTTWKPIPAALPATTFNLVFGENSQTLYAAAGQAGLWRTTDGGQNWSPLAAAPSGGVVALAYNRANKRLLITTLGNDAGLYASDDGGQSWKSLGVKGILMAVASSSTDPNRLVVVDENGWVYASNDAGATW